MTKVFVCAALAILLTGCESLPTTVFQQNNTTFNNKDVESCEGSYQCRIIELPSLPGCANPAGYQAYSSKNLDEHEIPAYEEFIVNKAKKTTKSEGCPMVYPAQALCVNKHCEAITLGK